MNIFAKAIWQIDSFQRRHKPTAFVFAVIKKYGDDQAGYQAALVTYYGFLALFPLLLVLASVASIVSNQDPELGSRLIDSVTSYFPTIGKSLEDSARGGAKTGLALIAGTLVSLYGARGIADAFRNAVNHVWHVPLAKRSGFPRSLLRSLGLIIGGGSGFIAASTIAGWAAAVGHGGVFRILSIICNFLVLYVVFMLIFRLSLPLSIPRSKFRVGAVVAAVGLTILQKIVANLLTNQTSSVSASFAVFATTLGLLAWLYLQAQVVMYAVVIDTVRDKQAWPRSLSGKKLTAADKASNKKRSL